MKKITITLTAIILIMFLFMGCDKYHRDRYTGDWDFVTEKNQYKYNVNEPIKSDTIYYFGKIYHGNDENTLIIQCTENDKVPTSVDKKGILWESYPTSYATCHQCSLGRFETKDKISLDCYRFEEDIVNTYQIIGRRSK